MATPNQILKQAKKELTEFNKSNRAGITGIERRLRRGREIGIRQRLQYAKEDVLKAAKLEVKIPYTNQELKWLGYKDKKDYMDKHTGGKK